MNTTSFLMGPSFLAGPGPRWFNIAAHRPFLEDLARGLLDALPGEDLAGAVVLLPSRRAVRALGEAFVKATDGQALLLPQIRALGDLEEGEPPFEAGDLALDLPAAIGPHRRRFELARLIAENSGVLGRSLDAAGALELADALAGFLDSAELEEAPLDGRADRIRRLAPEEMAEHWRVSADFLNLAVEAWPRRLQALGLADVAARRVRLLNALTEAWTARPPAGPVVAAGSTGAVPATARLLDAVARLPQGATVLPGLDIELAEDAWTEIEEQHPQGAMKRLLDRAGVARGAVRPWPGGQEASPNRWRRRIVNEALRPAKATADWLGQIRKLAEEGARAGVEPMAEGLKGLTVLAARDEEEAGALAALLLRETLQTPGKTCALITPDLALARRVSARLERWGVEADSSAGASLAGTPVGVLTTLVAQAVQDPGGPVDLLAILKHPLVRLGITGEALGAASRALERHALRGARGRAADWIEAKLDAAAQPRDDGQPVHETRLDAIAAARGLLGALNAALDLAAAPFATGRAEPATAARALAEALEALAAGPEGDAGRLWAGPDGEAAANLLAALIDEGGGMPPVSPAGFAALLGRLLDGETVRSARPAHPRILILGAIESRLIAADRLVLAGLEEGVWPQAAPTDPFLSRPMRAAFGLPPPERRVGLSAHDFAQAACAPEVILLHARRREGAPAVESRWLWRLGALARGAGVELPVRAELHAWAEALDAPEDYAPIAPPRPTPPVEARPRKLAVTRVETWVRDPYAVYARHVLGLRALDRPDEPVGAAARGTALHEAFRRFAQRWPDALPADPAAEFERMFLEDLVKAGAPEPTLAREAALAAEAARWMADWERARRADGPRLLIEQQGAMSFPAPGGDFTVTARADRIEAARDGFAHVIDYKTGRAPTIKEVDTGFSPQLTLTAAILEASGFADAPRATPGDLIYVRVTGRRPAGVEERRGAAGEESAAKAAEALEGLKALVARYDEPGQPYLSRTAPRFVVGYPGDYDHLARVGEWSAAGEDGESDGGGEP